MANERPIIKASEHFQVHLDSRLLSLRYIKPESYFLQKNYHRDVKLLVKFLHLSVTFYFHFQSSTFSATREKRESRGKNTPKDK